MAMGDQIYVGESTTRCTGAKALGDVHTAESDAE